METDTKYRTSVVGAGRGQRRRRTVIAASAAFVVLIAAVVIGVVAATREDGGDRSAPTTPSTTDADAGAGAATTARPATTAPSAEPVLENGRHPVYLTAIDVAGRRVEFDVIQFLTGDEAIAAWDEDHPDEPGGPPNDYYIINGNRRLRGLPVAIDAQVTVLDWNAGYQPLVVTFEDLPTELAAGTVPYEDRLGANPFWLIVDDDTITAIEEQFTP